MYAEAVEAFLKSGSLDGAPPERIEALREAFRTSGWQGYQRKRLENLEARAKNDYVSPTTFALIYVRLWQKDMAFAWFERALEAHDPRIVRFKIEPGYDSLRDDPRYAGLIRKIGLQP